MIDLYDAIELANSKIKRSDDGCELLESLVNGCEQYRSLYESAWKKLQLYREVAAMPDIVYMSLNKDVYSTPVDAMSAYNRFCEDKTDRPSFAEWMYMKNSGDTK